MPSIGIDIGSTAAKAAVLEDGRLAETLVCPTGFSSVDAAERLAQQLLARGFDPRGLPCVATGYGRVAVPYADRVVTEITCHGKGAAFLFGGGGTVVDVGGQDTKVIVLRGGKVVKFAMNDKCSAGTGKFLEVMANRLGVSQEELARLARMGAPTSISSMCTVFAESEVISLIAQNKEKADIANGVCGAIANKAFGLLRRVGLEPDFMMTGGVAKNPGVVRAVEEKIGSKLYICEEPEIVGATGAALYALEQMEA